MQGHYHSTKISEKKKNTQIAVVRVKQISFPSPTYRKRPQIKCWFTDKWIVKNMYTRTYVVLHCWICMYTHLHIFSVYCMPFCICHIANSLPRRKWTRSGGKLYLCNMCVPGGVEERSQRLNEVQQAHG